MSPDPATGLHPASPDAIATALSKLGDNASRDQPVGPLTTYRVGGTAAITCSVSTDDDLASVSAAVQASGLPTLVVGKGSNLLVRDGGFPGIAVVLAEGFDHIAIGESGDSATTVRAGGAASLPVVARRTAAASLTGFEWAVGVPGSVGGAVRMNAGGHGSDMAASLRSIRRYNLRSGEDADVAVSELDLGYRTSAIGADDLVLEAVLDLDHGDRERSEQEISEIVRWRRENQPGGQNAGSVFTNPEGDSAGRLIDAAALKGTRVGGAEVSDKHANFIQAGPDATASDIEALIALVKERVREAHGVELEAENRIVGLAPHEGPR